MSSISKFSIDMDDVKDIKKHISLLQNRRKKLLAELGNYTKIDFGVSKLNLNDVMNIFDFLVNIKHEKHGTVGNYYVYVHCNPLKKLSLVRDIREYLLGTKYHLSHVPFYVGKGINNRCDDLNRNEGHRKIRTRLLSENKDIMVVKVMEGITEEEALFEEQKLITFLGLSVLDKEGMLVNLQTENSIIDVFYEQLEKNFHPKEDRIKTKSKLLVKKMRSWIK